MAYRWHPKNAEVDPESPRAWGVCDRCGFVWNLNDLQWQYAYQGSTMPQNTRFLVCPKHLDPLNPQDTPNIIPPDPLPVYNARPENYVVDETNYLVTQDDAIIATQDGDLFITQIPNPGSNANTTSLSCTIDAATESVSVMYLDLFNGDPTAGGTSILLAITGSATRVNITPDLTVYSDIAQNTYTITVVSEALATRNVTHVGFYSASISGALRMSGPVTVASPNSGITVGCTVQFDAPNLLIVNTLGN